jgi:flavodoxin
MLILPTQEGAMVVLIVHDSIYGNTASIAQAMAQALQPEHAVRLEAVNIGHIPDLTGVDLLIIGSPTRGFRPTPAIQDVLEALPDAGMAGLRAAAFDTRLDLDTIQPAPLRWVVEVGGYAGQTIQRRLIERGCVEAGTATGFLVLGTEGPLKDGERERAAAWAKGLILNQNILEGAA